MQTNLSDTALLVVFNASMWRGSRLDRVVSNEVAKDKSANVHAGRYTKQLIAKKAFKKIESKITEARTMILTNSLPWLQDSTRIMKAEIWINIYGDLISIKSEFDDAVKEFISEYPNYVQQARSDLGKMFDARQYPRAESLKSAFKLYYGIFPVPQISEESEFKSQTKNHIRRTILDGIDAGELDCIERLADSITHLIDRLSISDRVFKDATITNIVDIAKDIQRLDIGGSKDIFDICESAKKIFSVDANIVRANLPKRENLVVSARDILSKIQSQFGVAV